MLNSAEHKIFPVDKKQIINMYSCFLVQLSWVWNYLCLWIFVALLHCCFTSSNWQLPFLKKRKEKRKYVARPGAYEYKNAIISRYFHIYQQRKFHVQLSWACFIPSGLVVILIFLPELTSIQDSNNKKFAKAQHFITNKQTNIVLYRSSN